MLQPMLRQTLRPASKQLLWALTIVGVTACSREGSRVSRTTRAATTMAAALDTSPGADKASIVIVGWSSTELDSIATRSDSLWQKIVPITVSGHDEIPVLGHYSANDSAIVFKPKFAFDAGRSYTVRVFAGNLPSTTKRNSVMTFVLSLPAGNKTPQTTVAHIYPGSDTLPENLLRLYIEFSAPMSRDGGLPYIKLLDDKGKEVASAFLPLDTDFWNDDRTRYTAFLDPGRVKRGILPNEQMGRATIAGRNYTIVVDSTWQDAIGLPLRASFRKTFHVVAPDESRIDLKQWKLSSPRAGTRDTLVVTFAKPLDHGLLKRALGVETVKGKSFPGTTGIERKEIAWRFVPNENWSNENYRLIVFSMLEDAAGNRIDRPFEVDMFDKIDNDGTPERYFVPITVRK